VDAFPIAEVLEVGTDVNKAIQVIHHLQTGAFPPAGAEYPARS
jgi:hypothetical protein